MSAVRKLTVAGHNRIPVWADNERVVFQSDREGDEALWWQRADGSSPAERLTRPDRGTSHLPESMSPDGKTLLLSVANGSTFTLAAWSMAEQKLTVPFAGVESSYPVSAAFAPDGKLFAYTTTTGYQNANAPALFVQPFPPNGSIFPVSKGNGIHGSWSADGKELFWGPAPGQFTGAAVTTTPSFSFSNPVMLPKVLTERGPTGERSHEVMPDGRHFLGAIDSAQPNANVAPTTPQMQLVLNWFDELKARVPQGPSK